MSIASIQNVGRFTDNLHIFFLTQEVVDALTHDRGVVNYLGPNHTDVSFL